MHWGNVGRGVFEMDSLHDDQGIADALDSIRPPMNRCKRLAGRTVDGYTLKELLSHGQGGMGVVYRAEHETLGIVAVKVFALDVREDQKAHEIFKTEARTLKNLGQIANMVEHLSCRHYRRDAILRDAFS